MVYQLLGIPDVFLGTSTDTKPTTVEVGSRCVEVDTGDTYITPNGVDWTVDTRSGWHLSYGRVALVTEDNNTRQNKGGPVVRRYGKQRYDFLASWDK